MAPSENKEQQHPQYNRDRQIINSLLAGEPTDYNQVELARLRIRYRGFPGATDIQTDLDKVLQLWGFTEAALYEKTRQLHAAGPVYKGRASKGEEEDWN
jgi:hypothetical protein